MTGHRSGAFWLFRKKIGGLTFIGFKIIKLSFAAIRIDQKFPATIPHRERWALVFRFAAFEDGVRMSVLPENGFGEIAVNLAWHWDHAI